MIHFYSFALHGMSFQTRLISIIPLCYNVCASIGISIVEDGRVGMRTIGI